MNFPSHANSSVGQVANAYAGNPQALMQRTQPQNGVTPELIDLLALQKLQAEKESAARQMAMANGQQPPTVAQGMAQQATQTARQEIAQKLGLPGLMSQGQPEPAQGSGQPPPGAPGTDLAQQRPQQPPAPPTQTMAQGGIVRLRSNLPSRYASGGIVAFDEGGQASGEAGARDWLRPRVNETPEEYQNRIKNGYEAGYNESDPQGVLDKLYGIAKLPVEAAGRALDFFMPPDKQQDPSLYEPRRSAAQIKQDRAPADAVPAGAAPSNSPPGPLPDIDTAVNSAMAASNGDGALRSRLFGELAKSYGADAVDAAVAKYAPQQAPVSSQEPSGGYGGGSSTRTRVSGITDLAQDTSPLRVRTEKSITDTMDTTPESEDARARKDYQDTTGQSFKAMQDAQASGLAKLQELQAREQAQRPSNLMRGLQLMGRNIHATGGIGGAFQGVGEGIDATNAGYTQQDIKMQSDLNTLDIAMKKAAQENDIGAYNAAQKARDTILGRISSAQQTAGTLLGHDEAARARVDAANARAEYARDNQKAIDESKMERVLTDIEKATEAQVKSAFTTPEEQNAAYQRMLAQNQRYQALRKKLGYEPMQASSAGPSIDLSKWGQPKVKG